jgi:serine/threonine protein kinase
MSMSQSNFHKQNTIPNLGVPQKTPVVTPVPKMIGPYRIKALLEKGGMSLLYLATEPKEEKQIVVKALLPQYLAHPEMVQRFINEAEIIRMSKHPNIITLYGQGKWDKGLYIAMEHIHGSSLREIIEKGKIPLENALKIILKISSALTHLHSHKIIHRDLKPENILITKNNEVKVIDFGIAQILDNKQARYNKGFIGTPVYMSPELRNTPEKASYPSDIYALGIITYELIIAKLSHGKIDLKLIPEGLRPILSKALQTKLSLRYQTVQEFIQDLSAFLNHLEPEAIPDEKSPMAKTLIKAQNHLLPLSSPQWPKLEIGLVSNQYNNLSGVYFDFVELSENAYGIIIAEPTSKGPESIVYTAGLRGIVKTLTRLTNDTSELVTLLNDILCEDSSNQVFTLNYLILKPAENTLHYLSCGLTYLWHVPVGTSTPKKVQSQHIALGIDPNINFLATTQPWIVGDTLVLNTCAAAKTDPKGDEKKFIQTLSENLHKTPQKLCNTLFQKANQSVQTNTRNITILSIFRKD